MLATESSKVKLNSSRSHVSIATGPDSLPIEVTITARLPKGTGRQVVQDALEQQKQHPEFIDEFNEPSAIIGKTNFKKEESTAVYTFGVDTRDLVFHRHAGHRVITAITGDSGCVLKFSVCSPEEATKTPGKFLDNLFIVDIPADRLFVLRFSGTVYHQFCPKDHSENAFFAISVHSNEAGGLTGELLELVLANQSNIALLTEPAPPQAMALMEDPEWMTHAVYVTLDA